MCGHGAFFSNSASALTDGAGNNIPSADFQISNNGGAFTALTNTVPFGQGGPVSGPYGTFSAAGAKGGFGFTGGHYHKNWGIDDQRRMIVNAILWVAKVDIDINSGGLAADPRFFPHDEDFRGMRVHQTRLQGGDASSDYYCFTS